VIETILVAGLIVVAIAGNGTTAFVAIRLLREVREAREQLLAKHLAELRAAPEPAIPVSDTVETPNPEGFQYSSAYAPAP